MAYVSLQELPKYGVSVAILAEYTDDEIATAMATASTEADTYLSAHYGELPLTQYPEIVKKHVASAVLKHLFDLGPGRSPQGDNKLIDDNYVFALGFYKAIQNKKQVIPQAATTPKASNAVVVASAIPDGTPRGW